MTAFDGAYSSAFALFYTGTAPASPRTAVREHDVVPLNWQGNPTEWQRKSAEVTNGAMEGRTNNRGTVSLSISQAGGAVTKTPIIDNRINGNSVLIFSAVTPNAAALLSSLYVTSLTYGSCTLNHASTDSTTAIFDFVVFS